MSARRGRSTPAPAPSVVLQGPRDGRNTLSNVIEELEAAGAVSPDSRIAAVTAGWREREAQVGLFDPRLAARVVDLELYRRSARVADADPELARAHREAQDRLDLLRRAYNVRLAGRIDAYVRLVDLRGDASVLAEERAEALEAIRRLDERQLARVAEIRSEFERAYTPEARDPVRAQRREVERLLEDAEAVVIAGGHVGLLLSRLRLFGGRELLGERAVIGRSAGAMVLTDRVVLFHDRPPWGAGNPEVFDAGLGLAEGIVALPHASARLVLDDRDRTSRLAARFAPAACVLLAPGQRVDRAPAGWSGHGGVERIDRAGRCVRLSDAA
ncbi:Type 1 glutamine amidotransferase-like domain-containing protein [Candidatus Palauibacter sp.]|uniref:Type 1 glutamine amidotransferase-like domain-containing protein n=1 Tax=Candidatus Palauibacter sp. TaxID=3101350 RepID=UPI003AF3133C